MSKQAQSSKKMTVTFTVDFADVVDYGYKRMSKKDLNTIAEAVKDALGDVALIDEIKFQIQYLAEEGKIENVPDTKGL
jgi:hypothetical protein